MTEKGFETWFIFLGVLFLVMQKSMGKVRRGGGRCSELQVAWASAL